jgi:hypothetical protein
MDFLRKDLRIVFTILSPVPSLINESYLRSLTFPSTCLLLIFMYKVVEACISKALTPAVIEI